MRKSGESMAENSRSLQKQITQNKTQSHMASNQRFDPSIEVKEHSVFMLDPCSDCWYFHINSAFDPTVDWHRSNFEVFYISKQKTCGICNYFGQ
jgi:hypothetical protein